MPQRMNPAPRLRAPLCLLLGTLAAFLGGCAAGESSGSSEYDQVAVADPNNPESPYQATVDEGLGAAIAILFDTSGSMDETAPGDNRRKHEVALEAVEQMLLATEEVVKARPDFPVKVGIYKFDSSPEVVLPIQPYDRAAVQSALASMPGPGGGTGIGDAMAMARADLYQSGVFRKYLLVITDGENTEGRSPEQVGREIHRRSQGAVQIYFVAFDTSPEKFGFLKEIQGDVIAANGGDQLRAALSEIYQGKILAESANYGEGAVTPDTTSQTENQ